MNSRLCEELNFLLCYYYMNYIPMEKINLYIPVIHVKPKLLLDGIAIHAKYVLFIINILLLYIKS